MSDQYQFNQYLDAGNIDISLVLLQRYHEIGLTDQELIIYLQIKAMLDRGYVEPSTEKIAKYMGLQPTQVFSGIENMRAKNLVVFETKRDENKRLITTLNFHQLYQKLLKLPDESAVRAVDRQSNNNNSFRQIKDEPTRAEIFTMLEQEFGRSLSPIDLEIVSNWFDVDHFLPVLIQEAIKEAVANQALNLRYIESILVNWTKQNYHSKQDVLKNSKRRKNFQNKQNGIKKDTPKIPLDVDLLSLDPKQL
ncbi:DNA replication protein DnaD [Weissella koreensis KACC 15510]|uniref:DnaD domain protein n=1 Tax=Weissella koreensis TaxID=165096 RepID=UPI000217556D|nr:DnaD domain protein [Weissella koreensis]AEJ24073.1 DNA replication protein DnaD [Weissella koreensis KACC 15510]